MARSAEVFPLKSIKQTSKAHHPELVSGSFDRQIQFKTIDFICKHIHTSLKSIKNSSKSLNKYKEKIQKDFTAYVSALRTKSGKIYTGINLRYRFRMAVMCSERVAIFKVEDDGENELDTIVGLKYFPEIDDYELFSPCAACRQVEVYYPGLKTILPDENDVLVIKRLKNFILFLINKPYFYH